MNNFSELSVSSVIKTNLTRNNWVTMTPVQSEAIPPALAGRDLIATAQTGTGKTLAFTLPLLESLIANPAGPGTAAVILSPTRELAIQIHEAFTKIALGTSIKAAVVVGGMNEQAQLRAIKAGASVLIATPGRLSDFMERRLVKLSTARILVLDEADRMLDMGFLPVIRRILSELPAKRQTLFFSATIEKSVSHLIESYLKNPVRITIGPTSKPAENIEMRVYEIDQNRKIELLHWMLEKEQGSFLVFAKTKHGTDRLAKTLSRIGVRAACIHGDRTQNQRNQALKGFQQGQYRVLVATDVAARGLHVDGIAHVVNFDLPQVPEDFIHRVGRTGRAGAVGIASTFATPSDRSEIRKIERVLNIKLIRSEVSRDVLREHILASKITVIPVAVEERTTLPREVRSRAGGFRRRDKSR